MAQRISIHRSPSAETEGTNASANCRTTSALIKRSINRPCAVLTVLLTILTSAALAQAGTVLGFGDNQSGQIGDSTTTNRSLLTPAYTISGIKAIVCGYNHTLALDSSGVVWAWGDNGLGQLGTGDTTSRTTPVAVASGIKAIAAGAAHSLALDAGGTVWAWGDNFSGQLGTGDNTIRYTPTPMSGLNTPVTAIACGGLHSLMLGADSTLYGCGYNGYGQLGLGDNTDRSVPTPLRSLIVAMAAGYAHTLVLDSSHQVWTTGYNADGELGEGGNRNENTFGTTAFAARSIAAGHYHSLAVLLDGRVFAWGSNASGQLGTGDFVNRYFPTLMPGTANARAVAGGEQHTLVLTAGGKVLSTGTNAWGQLGDGTTTTRNRLVAVNNASFIGAISAGSYHSVLLKPFTQVLSTGLNTRGQLGMGGIRYISQVNSPVPMLSGNSILAVSTGPSGWHSVLLRADGTVWVCGDNDFGQLGNGTTAGSTIPVQVKGPGGVGMLTNIIAIAAGNFHSLALDAGGNVWAWGRNSHGQLGTGDTIDRHAPVRVWDASTIGGASAIAAGGYHSLLLRGLFGTIWTCGYNGYGQLGFGDTLDRSSFTYNGSGDTIGLAGGNFHSMTLFWSGVLVPFGLNSNGQLGTGDTTNRYLRDLEAGTQAFPMAAGGYHTVVLNAAGQVWEAGYNGDGELGVGDNADRYFWTYNGNFGGVDGPGPQIIGIACGYAHSLFLDPYGDLYACGSGVYGQLGNGSTANQNLPTLVPGAPFATAAAGGFGHTLILTTPRLILTSLKVNPSSVVGGAGPTGTAVGTVTLNGPGSPGGQRVYLSYSNGAASGPGYVDVPPTSKTASFPIRTSSVGSTTTVEIVASMPGSNFLTAWLTINPSVIHP